MKNKTCGKCRFYFEQAEFCRKNAWECIEEDKECCDEFEKPTNGDRIISGGMRELAKAMVYGYRVTDFDGQVTDEMLYTWHLPNAKAFTEYNEAVNFLENWLNAPADCVKQNGNHYTQADLCKVDNTESEGKEWKTSGSV